VPTTRAPASAARREINRRRGQTRRIQQVLHRNAQEVPGTAGGVQSLTPAISPAKRLRRLLRSSFILFARPPPASSLLPASFSACSLTSAHLLQTPHPITKVRVHLRYDRRLKLLRMGPIEHHTVSGSCQSRSPCWDWRWQESIRESVGVGRENRVADSRARTTPRKIRARFDSHKHISLSLPVSVSPEIRLFSVQDVLFVTFAVTLGRRRCCRVGL
jgi:hypothetical protein